MKRRTNKKKKIITIFLIVLVVVTVGYAVVVSQLKLIGNTTLRKNLWKVYFANVQLNPGSATNDAPRIGEDSGDPEDTKVTFTTTLSSPGDYYEFTVDAVNEGTVDAMITGKSISATPALPEYIKYSVTYGDGVDLGNNHILPKAVDESTPTRETLKVRVEFDGEPLTNAMLENMTDNVHYTFDFTVTYAKATSSGVPRPYHIASCPGCVFGYYTTSITFSEYDDQDRPLQRDTLTDYTEDYKSVKRVYYTSNDDSSDPPSEYSSESDCGSNCTRHVVQRKVFLGSVLDSNNVVQRGFVCVLKDDEPICVEGKVTSSEHPFDRATYTRNKNLVYDIWGDERENDCTEYDESTNHPSFYCSNYDHESIYMGNREPNEWSATIGSEHCATTYNGWMSCDNN